MASNILKKSSDANIIISYYLNGRKIRHEVILRYSDDEETYFAMPMPINFVKPKPKTDIEITYRSSMGLLHAVTKLIDSTLSLQEILFTVKTPKIWEDKEARKSKRKLLEIPATVKYADKEIKTKTFDIALGGVSVEITDDLDDMYKQIPATINLEFNQDDIVTVQGKFVRTKNVELEEVVHLYVYKFTNNSNLTNIVIKKHLLAIE